MVRCTKEANTVKYFSVKMIELPLDADLTHWSVESARELIREDLRKRDGKKTLLDGYLELVVASQNLTAAMLCGAPVRISTDYRPDEWALVWSGFNGLQIGVHSVGA